MQTDYGSESDEDAPSLVLEPEPRSTLVRQQPERYNPLGGQSYVEICHNIVTQSVK